jgi:uncharacterized protein (TIGR02996 family)
MTEDESFIRAIVDTPGDDTARLVYADWLDDRDDFIGTGEVTLTTYLISVQHLVNFFIN